MVFLPSKILQMEKPTISMVDLKGQYQKIKNEIDSEISKVIDSTAFINGPIVKEFQQNLAEYMGCRHVITCGNGTDALQISMMALGLQPGDEVITTPFTFIATVEVVALLGLTPVFVDVCPDTYNIDVTKIEAAITPRTKAIVPVHLFGQCADMERIMEIADKHGLYVIEDACQAIGAEVTFRDGSRRKAGTIGTIGCTSFFPSKNLGCYGDGGAIFTNDDDIATRLRGIANHGSFVKYHHDLVGVNSRLDSIQAAILNVKLRYLDSYNTARQKAAATYCQLLSDCAGITLPSVAPFTTHVFHQFTLCLDESIDRTQVQEKLKAAGIPSMVYYPVPIHEQKAFAKFGCKAGDFPVAEKLCRTVLSLPMHTEMTDEMQKYITDNLIDDVLSSRTIRIIGITGTLGAGKGTVVEYLKEKYGFVHFSVRDFLKEEVLRRGMEPNRDSFTQVANELRAAHSPSYVTDCLYERAAQQPHDAVIESIRTPGEIDSLQAKGNFRLWAVDADPEIRYQRAVLRNSETDHVTYETFLANERREMTSTDPNKQNLSVCIARADTILQNNGDLAALYQAVDEVMLAIPKKY